jgi:hypothetical protein
MPNGSIGGMARKPHLYLRNVQTRLHPLFVDKAWRSRWTGAILVAVFLSITVYFWWRTPSPGKAVAALAVGAAVITFRELGGGGKFLWLVILLGLLMIENRAIDKDRADNDRKQQEFIAEQHKNFKKITDQAGQNFQTTAEALQTSIGALAKVMAQTQQIEGLAGESIKNATGGDSYIYFDVQGQNPTLLNDDLWVSVIPHIVGKYPLHSVIVTALCPTGQTDTVDYGTIYPNQILLVKGGGSIILHLPSNVPEKDMVCSLLINTSNGGYIQELHFFRKGSAWFWNGELTGKGYTKIKRMLSGPIPPWK